MALALSSRPAADPSHFLARSAADLAWTRAATLNIGLWPRTLPPAIARRFAEAATAGSFAIEAEVDLAFPDQARRVAASLADPGLEAFVWDDLRRLLPTFAAITGETRLVVRLDTVRDGMCEKLHADYVTLRMLCTYAGPGTQWVDAADVVYGNLRRTDVPLEEANASILRHPAALRQVSPGDVLALKGEDWPGGAGRGAVHRSPPMGDSTPPRLLLRIDAAGCRR